MKHLHFAEKINGTDETGLLDISVTPPELICICTKERAVMIMHWYNDAMQHKQLGDEIGKYYQEDEESDSDEMGLIEIGEAAAQHYGYL